jgi:hypothetical protein
MVRARPLATLVGLLASLALGGEAHAQVSAAELLEKARAQAGGIEELKSVLNGPDANMRLATFDVMMDSGDDTLREVALDLGLASTDRVLQALAFKHAVLSLGQIHFELKPDESAPEKVRTNSENALARAGNAYVLKLGARDLQTGKFALGKSYMGQNKYSGEVSGLTLSFDYGNERGAFELDGDDRLVGRLNGSGTQYEATARIR